MTERGILFKGHLVREILADRKTVTRRLNGLAEINAAPDEWAYTGESTEFERKAGGPVFVFQRGERVRVVSPPWWDGERMWVRETWNRCPCTKGCSVVYRADEEHGGCPECEQDIPWKPSIFMPRWASRITLEVVSVRVERLQEITEEDAQAEGLPWTMNCGAKQRFKDTWDAINRKRGAWASNPWVWVIGFRRVKP